MIITLMIGSFVAILNQTLMISALPTLMHEFDVPSSTVQWLTTGFMLTNGIMIPITAFLIETFTTRQSRSPRSSSRPSPRASCSCTRWAYLQNDLGVNALVSGLVMMPSDIAMGILNPVAGKMYDRIGGRPLALLGFAIMTSARSRPGTGRCTSSPMIAAVLLVTIMNTHTAAAMRTGVPEAAASKWGAIGVRSSSRTVAIVCAV